MCTLNIKKIKILIITTVELGMNGITNVILNYYREMDKSNMQVDFVVPNVIRNNLEKELQGNGSKIYVIQGRIKKPLNYMYKLNKVIKLEDYDIVHAHGNSCTLALEMYAAKKAGVPIRIPHSHNTTCKHKFSHRLLRLPFNRYYTNAFACGEKAGEWLFNGKSFEIINNGIKLEKYVYNEEIRRDFREKYKLRGKKVIGHIGHFSYQKNHDYLIDIFKELYFLDKNYRLILIGDGQLREIIEKKINNLGLSNTVIFTGKTNEVPGLLQAMDAMVMPSHFEGLPLTLVEAQAACLPCFASSNISEEAAITNLVKFISLESSPMKWATKINSSYRVDRLGIKEQVLTEIIDKGYSISNNAKKMKELYFRYLN